MSLDNIHLPLFLYESLFKNNLVEKKSKKKDKASEGPVKITFLGGNEKKIIMLAKDTHSKFLNDNQMRFLNGLLIACSLTMNDVAFINVFQNDTIKYKDLTDQLNPQKLLMFGVSASELSLPFEIPFFQIQTFNNHQYMLAPSLEELQKNVASKKQLWAGLQKLFNIKK